VVDSEGCTVPQDTDGDGVDDSLDRCPATAAGTQVDAVGCPILFRDQQTILILEGVTFASGRADLTQAARAILLTVAQSLIGNPTVRVEIAGHTDITGSRDVNMRLSQSRADAVRNFLIRNGVDAERLVARGYGPDEAVADNATAAGRAENRRVELRRQN
jgi:OOP family OmpA-OmpF porin